MKTALRMELLALALLLLVLPAAAEERSDLAANGERLFRVQGCYGCHMVGKFGTPMAANLSHIGARYSEAYLSKWLSDPEAQRPNAHMPKLELDPAEVAALAAYLATLR